MGGEQPSASKRPGVRGWGWLGGGGLLCLPWTGLAACFSTSGAGPSLLSIEPGPCSRLTRLF